MEVAFKGGLKGLDAGRFDAAERLFYTAMQESHCPKHKASAQDYTHALNNLAVALHRGAKLREAWYAYYLTLKAVVGSPNNSSKYVCTLVLTKQLLTNEARVFLTFLYLSTHPL